MSSSRESSDINDESSTSYRTRCKDDVLSFLEPRDPSIVNPWMRPRPTHGTNLCNLFDEVSYKMSTSSEQHVKVYLRIKPLDTDFSDMYQIESETTLKTLHNGGNSKTSRENILYKFTHIFNKCNQVSVFNKLMKTNLKEYIFNARDFTLMTYGASGSGKTYSLMGISTQPGIIPRCLEFLFQQVNTDSPLYKPDDSDQLIPLSERQQVTEVKNIEAIVKKCKDTIHEASNLTKYRRMSTALSRASQEWKRANEEQLANTHCEVWVSFAEIYNESIFDLLDEGNGKDQPNRLKLILPPDHKPYIKGLKWICVRSGIEAFSVLTRGRSRLKYANTNVNATSSRSHCIFTLKLIILHKDTKVSRISTFRLCDLAGLERAKMTENKGKRLNESKKINSSLHVLEKCLHALKIRQHGQQALPPYRESKLTALLQNALSGKENIAMLVTLNPEKKFCDETQHVLKFSALAQELLVDVPPKTDLQMSRNYSDIPTHLSTSPIEISKLLEDIERREKDIKQRDCYLSDWEAELETLQADLDSRFDEWEEKERRLRQELSAKFIEIQDSIYTECNNRIDQEKRVLKEEYDFQINKWMKISGELDEKVKNLRNENKHLKARIADMQIMLEETAKINCTTKISQSCNTETLNTTKDFTTDSRAIDDTDNTCTIIKDVSEKYEDFLLYINRINDSKEESVDDKLAELIKSMDIMDKTVLLAKLSDASQIKDISKSFKKIEIDDNAINNVPDKSNAEDILQFETRENSEINQISLKESVEEQNEIKSVTNITQCKPVDVTKIETIPNNVELRKSTCPYQSKHANVADRLSSNAYDEMKDENHSCGSISSEDIINKPATVDNCDTAVAESEQTSEDNGYHSVGLDGDIANIDTMVIKEDSRKTSVPESNTYTDKANKSEINHSKNDVSCKSDNHSKSTLYHSLESDDNDKPRTRSRRGKPDETQTVNGIDVSKNQSLDKSDSDKSSQQNKGPRTKKQLKLNSNKNGVDTWNDENKTPSPAEEKDVEIVVTESVGGGGQTDMECNNVLKGKQNNVDFRGLPLPDSYFTAKKIKNTNDLDKENCQTQCLSSRRKLFSRRQMDEIAADPHVRPVSAKCLFFEVDNDSSTPDPNKPPSIPKPYTYQKPTRSTRQRKKL